MPTASQPLALPPFVKPVRIPDEVECQQADPPVARAGETGRWFLPFVLSEAAVEGTKLGLLFHGGRNVKGTWQGLQAENPSAAGADRDRIHTGVIDSPLSRLDRRRSGL